MLSHIARVGGALGISYCLHVHNIRLETHCEGSQQMANAKLGFRLPTRTASEVLIDSGLD